MKHTTMVRNRKVGCAQLLRKKFAPLKKAVEVLGSCWGENDAFSHTSIHDRLICHLLLPPSTRNSVIEHILAKLQVTLRPYSLEEGRTKLLLFSSLGSFPYSPLDDKFRNVCLSAWRILLFRSELSPFFPLAGWLVARRINSGRE